MNRLETGREIWIYNGKGVDQDCAAAAFESLEGIVDTNCTQIKFLENILNLPNHNANHGTLVMPGGYTFDLQEGLQESGLSNESICKRVYNFVSSGNYLGFGGGSALGCAGLLLSGRKDDRRQFEASLTFPSNIHFDFFKGACAGPLQTMRCSHTPLNHCAVPVKWMGKEDPILKDEPINLFGNCSLWFVDAANREQKVLLEYCDTEIEGEIIKFVPYRESNPAAAIACKVGEQGKALLSGVHPEIRARHLKTWKENDTHFTREWEEPSVKKVIKALSKEEEMQERVLRLFASEIGLPLKQNLS